MSDSFADLWNSSTPAKPSQPDRKLGGSTAASSSTLRPKYDAFSVLAASGSNSSSPRSLTPSIPVVPTRTSIGSGAARIASGDAFSDLLSGSFGVDSGNKKLSMAEKAAMAKTQVTQVTQQPTVPLHSTSAWAGLDSFARSASFSHPQKTTSSSSIDDDWPFGSSTNSAQTELASDPKSLVDDWGLEDFTSRPNPASDAPSGPLLSLWDPDNDEFPADQEHHVSPPARGSAPSRSDTPGDFDFGDRENALLDDDSGSDDNILGGLGRPNAAPVTRISPPSPSSPPPHLVGQIVEIGFSPDQARAALASTESGVDVQAALETLLSEAPQSSSAAPEQLPSGGSRRTRDRHLDNDDWGDEQQDLDPSRRRFRKQLHSSQERPPPSSETNYQQQTDKIIAQASEIGSQLFQRANAFWKEGKSRMQKAYEERAGNSGYSEGHSGRPKWMPEDLGHNQEVPPEEHSQTSFRDGETDAPSTLAKPSAQIKSHVQSKTVNLFGDTPIAYVSPFRRSAGSRAVPPPSPAHAQTVPRRVPSPVHLTERQVVSAPPSAISASAKHKASGTEMFKLGRFAEAETAYTSAISQLPDSHLLLVPLLNNRGLSRLKTGTCRAPSKIAKVTREEDGASVDLGDALIKAWRRRAEAYEAKEKWDLARQDWESIAGAGFGGRHRGEALNSVGRCKKMLSANNASNSHPRPSHALAYQQAVARLKQANQEAEAEEYARLQLKDSIDSRLAAWKNGKENNLRALVASLDTVLWPELGWQRVGMAELVTPNQVKIRYTKAIAKLHPTRMIANGVFSALNDAWNTFKP
ncbi:hypothetical protein B0F90DRAFT_1807722 [Multifurca ochricompacta]|uniref:UBA domain-containing protein n=1 Tax=Multifurca ochricompacta TaxID=376703 RepID=A0AAD4MBC0_9AGAM|nr:hypothetical protein B0F90DRAFT_1807722 [Multifurca ochricompacta]